MSDIEQKELDPRLRKQVEKARDSLKRGNFTLAIDICLGILAKTPGYLEAREVLRTAQKAGAAGKKFSLGGLLGMPLAKVAALTAKKDPAKAMLQAEKLITQNPANAAAYQLLGQAADACDLPHTAAFAFESVREINPGDIASLKILADLYIRLEKIEEAIRLCDTILRKSPGDGEAQDLVKRASVAQSMRKGKWEEEGDFRSKLKDADEAVKLEQASRSITDEENLANLIEETLAKHAEEPENLNHYRQLTTYYSRLGNHDEAISWVQKARKIPAGASDVSLERMEAKLRKDQIEARIKEKQDALDKDPDNAALSEELEQMRTERQEYLLTQARDMVERYPNDYGARFQLGELLFEDGKSDEAIQQLQIAVRNPKVRIAGLGLLGRAYKQKKFFDMAAEQFNTAKRESSGMNEVKKEIIYELAQCYEAMGKEDEAIQEYKEIYSNDIGFRDVAAKIDAFYAKRNQT